LKENGVEMNAAKAKYSINKGSLGHFCRRQGNADFEGISAGRRLAYGCHRRQECVILSWNSKKESCVAIDGQKFGNPVAAIQHLQAIAQPYGVGRDIHVGDTIIGIKGGSVSKPRPRSSSSKPITCWKSIR
jgi:argininosuccinate synthase